MTKLRLGLSLLSLDQRLLWLRAGDPHSATTSAPSELTWGPGPQCPAAWGGDRPRRPPDGGMRVSANTASARMPGCGLPICKSVVAEF